MPTEAIVAWLGALVAVGGAVGAFVKSRAESKQITVSAAGEIIELLRTEVQRLNQEVHVQRDERVREREERDKRITGLETDLGRVQRRVRRLEEWLVENGYDPASINGPEEGT
jgi:predicted RNase H-like nuclease (RuvC/YqgF family)